MTELLLETRGLSKRYGDVTVVKNVSLEIQAGEIHALLGANGAGKSTLCKMMSGLIPATDGSMWFRGAEYRPKTKQQAEAAGVEIVQQELNLIGTLSVAENLFLTRFPSRAGVIRDRELRANCRDVLDRFGLADVQPETPVESLGIGRQQMVEIATAMARRCQLLILDEPTAALSGSESQQLFDHLCSLREQGVGILYVSHRLEEVADLTDRVTVLRDGQFVATRQTNSLSTGEMVELISGEVHSSAANGHISHCGDEIAISVRSLSCGKVQDVSFDVRHGERFGIAGLVGSGRTELLRAIFGADVATSGDVRLSDQPEGRRFQCPSEAVAAGLAMVTEDRKQNGLLLPQSVTTNTTLTSLWPRFSRFGVVNRFDEGRVTRQLVKDLETRCESIDQPVGTLSGGNQQKVAVAKWLVSDATYFLFDEPTRGIDVAARMRIYRLIESLAERGKASVIVSSDLDELIEICDSIAVMCNGRLVDTFRRGQWSYEKFMQASFSGDAK